MFEIPRDGVNRGGKSQNAKGQKVEGLGLRRYGMRWNSKHCQKCEETVSKVYTLSKSPNGSSKPNIKEKLCQMQFLTERKLRYTCWAACKQCPNTNVILWMSALDGSISDLAVLHQPGFVYLNSVEALLINLYLTNSPHPRCSTFPLKVGSG